MRRESRRTTSKRPRGFGCVSEYRGDMNAMDGKNNGKTVDEKRRYCQKHGGTDENWSGRTPASFIQD